ncbi:hypothetical protein [Paenibacillus alvei]|uniref:hypothetical protein n=1 Tax=Paenibacillus alvei TaxID=44250 RepID=UPI001267E441|nr:hypothetical protein [Paenibacillus alvei]
MRRTENTAADAAHAEQGEAAAQLGHIEFDIILASRDGAVVWIAAKKLRSNRTATEQQQSNNKDATEQQQSNNTAATER